MIINTINVHILGMPIYFFCAFMAFVLTICMYIMLMASKKNDVSLSMKILFVSIVGLVLGARLFGIISGIYRDIGLNKNITLSSLKDTGIVFYGGLFGFITIYFWCLESKHCSLDRSAIDILAVCIPFFHSISRLGCFFSGCCYGKIYNGIIAIRYITIVENQLDDNFRFPVQLVESLLEFIIFIYLFRLFKNKDWTTQSLLLKYLTMYSIGRFILEFFRGDLQRGLIHGISFSQLISIVVLMRLFIYWYKSYTENRR